MIPVPPPHPVRPHPVLAGALTLAAAGVLTLASCDAPAAATDCLDVTVTWDGATVAWVTATVLAPDEDVAPRLTFQVLGEGNSSLFYEQVTGQATATVYPAVDGATAVLVEEGWRPGPLCQVWTYPPEDAPDDAPEAVEPPAYTPVTPEPGDHRDDTPAPATEPVTPGSRVLHSL